MVLNLICSISVILQSANPVVEPSSAGQPDKFPGLYCLFDLWHWPFLYGHAGPPGLRTWVVKPFLYGHAGPPGLRTWLDKPFLYGHAGPPGLRTWLDNFLILIMCKVIHKDCYR